MAMDILRSPVSAVRFFNGAAIRSRCCRTFRFNVKSSLFSTDEKVLEKNDQTPVTVADFGVQALISLELNKLFPSIPLVAEEDCAFLRSRNLAGTLLNEVTDTVSSTCKPLTQDDVLEAIDRGGKDAFVFGSKPATYWVDISKQFN